jgi:hypothetical protein
MPVVVPLKRPSASTPSSVAITSSKPSSAAVCATRKRLVAVVSTSRSPRPRYCLTNARADGARRGRITSAMKASRKGNQASGVRPASVPAKKAQNASGRDSPAR